MSQFDDDPFRSPNPTTHYPPQQPPQGSKPLIITIAVINYVFGGLQLACGACVAIFGAGFMQVIMAAAQENQKFDANDKAAVGVMTAVVIGVGVITGLLGLPLILAGYGVQTQREWGRILTIVLAGISGLLALLSLMSLSPVGLIYAAYTIFTLVVLLNPDNARMFR
ncbi:hypothetical protein GC197_05300 [bacterium]|nr:hypothetical protein [bacterium]